MDSIRIGEPEVVGSRVEVDATASRRLRRFLSEDTFWVEYDKSVEQCPNGILVVPAVVTLAPVAWAAGATITVDEIDSTFAESLPDLFYAYQEQYPFIFTDEVKPVQYSKLCDYEPSHEQSSTSSAMLFTGGVDSLTSYLKHRNECPALFTVYGADLNLGYHEGWQRIQTSVETFSESKNLCLHVAKSNFREILSYLFLNHNFMANINRNWWGAIHYGTGLPSLCAPIAYMNGYEFIYQGSGYTSDPEFPEAQPSFVHTLRWGRTKSRITEVQMSRQAKIEYLANNLQEINDSVMIRSCYSDNTGRNCSACEKCRRTILGLCIEGVDPNTVGYDVDHSTLDSIRYDLAHREMSLKGVRLCLWRDLQNRATERQQDNIHMGDSDFYEWFRSVDLSEFTRDNTQEEALGDKLTAYMQNTILDMPYPADIFFWSMAKSVKQRLPF